MNAECARVFRTHERNHRPIASDADVIASFLGRFLRKAIMKSKSRLATLLVLVAATLVVSVSWSSQSLAGTTGGIQGYVTDPTGHPLAGVAVSAVCAVIFDAYGVGTEWLLRAQRPAARHILGNVFEGWLPELIIPGATQPRIRACASMRGCRPRPKRLRGVTVRVRPRSSRPTQTADTYVVNQTTLSNLNGTPQGPQPVSKPLTRCLASRPTTAGYPTIRAGR